MARKKPIKKKITKKSGKKEEVPKIPQNPEGQTPSLANMLSDMIPH